MDQTLTAAIVDEFRKVVEGLFIQAGEWVQAGAPGGLEAWEDRVRDSFQPLERRILEAVIEGTGKGYPGPRRTCPVCQKAARYVGDRTHRLRTAVGELRALPRAYYHGCDCAGGSFPQDQTLGLDASGRSPGYRRLLALAGSMSSFETATDVLWELGRLPSSRTTVERVTEEEGTRAEAFLRSREAQGDAGLRIPQAPPKDRLYLETDGTTAPTREGWKEVKLGAVFEGEDPQERQVQYTASFETVEDFLPRLRGLARGAGATAAPEVVLLADGAEWIWKRVPPETGREVTQIVDWYHAKERLFEVAGSVYGEQSSRGHRWAEARTSELWEGKVEEVLAKLGQLAPRGKEAKDLVRQSLGYYQENRDRMRYDRYRAQGYDIGSGVIESACKHVVGGRLKGAGMRWNRDHAQKVLALRLLKANCQWEEFWEESRPRAA